VRLHYTSGKVAERVGIRYRAGLNSRGSWRFAGGRDVKGSHSFLAITFKTGGVLSKQKKMGKKEVNTEVNMRFGKHRKRREKWRVKQ